MAGKGWTVLMIVIGCVAIGACGALSFGASPAGTAGSGDALAFTVTTIDGERRDLGAYRGKVVMIVNTASECGLTPQYAGLQDLYERYEDEGFVVLGFPANDFMGQEPGTDDQIAAFCEKNYGVTFPMFSKISVKGADRHPLYARLTGQPEPVGGEVEWNFQKYLVDRSGKVVAKFSPRVKPGDEEVTGEVERLLAETG